MTVREMKQQFNHKLKHLSLCIVTALATQATMSLPAYAQEKEKQVERISVIGSHIKVNHDTGALPVTSISAEDIENSGATSGAELLAQIPQQGEVSFNSSRASGGVNDARGDVSSYNLRGLGTGNTLVLLNGRRLVLHPGTQSENFVPVATPNSNTLPVRGLKRVEVLRDGAAAIYGSDAVAGVVNYALKDDYEGSELNLNYGSEQGTDRNALNISGATGFFLNQEKTHISLSGGYYDRKMLMASEKSYAASSDLRENERFPEEFQGDSQIRGLSGSTPWLEGKTSSIGTFALQPDSFTGCDVSATAALDVTGVCVDPGSQSSNDRYDRNTERSLSSGVKRANFYGMLTHQLTDDVELYGEALYYYAQSKRIREQSGVLSSQRFSIAANSYYNPFGETVSIVDYRPVDTGTRNIKVTDKSYRFLTGLRGYYNDWDWDSAVLYSKSTTEDKTNRIDTQLFQTAINSTDQASAYDLFNGANVDNVNVGDPTGNSQDVIDGFMIDVVRDSATELALIDFKVSRADLFELPAGEVGVAAGVEYRYESFSDLRSDALNTTTQFLDVIGGAKNSDQYASTVLGSSPTPDAVGSRNVFSMYGELAIPLLEGLPMIDRLDMQVAARYERFSDVGDILKPKVSLAWIVNDYVQVRASYAEGFKAPGLPQVVAQNVSRVNTRDDLLLQDDYGILEVRSGGDDLRPEESTSLSWGFVIQPTDNLTLTADWWQMDQTDTVGILHANTQLAYDALLRYQEPSGDGNPLISRNDDNEVVAIKNNYVNLQDREAAGFDVSVSYDLATDFGQFKFKANAAKLMKFSQAADDITSQIIAAQNSSDTALVEALKFQGDTVEFSGIGDLIENNGRPEWRVTSSLGWRNGAWGAGLSYRYVSDFDDTSLDYSNEANEKVFYRVSSFSRANAYVNYRLPKDILEKTKITFGMKNISDKKPPIADESFGYNSSVHSSLGRYVYFNLNKKF